MGSAAAVRGVSYYAPKSLQELLAILAEKKAGAKVLAGGTDFVVAMREGELDAGCIVALHKVPDLQGIALRGDMIVIGAMVTHTAVEKSPLIQAKAALLAQAAATVGSPQIRNAGTVGGNLCNASPAADTVPALVALGARAKIVRQGGERELAVEDLFLGMGKTKLADDEMVQEISFKALQPGVGSAFIKLGRRNALAISRISVAAILAFAMSGGVYGVETVADCRIALGAVAQNPFRARSAENALRDQEFSAYNLEVCVAAACREIDGKLGQRASAVYKKKAGPALVRRALEQAAACRQR